MFQRKIDWFDWTALGGAFVFTALMNAGRMYWAIWLGVGITALGIGVVIARVIVAARRGR